MIEAGFVILAAAVVAWCHLFIPRAAMACGDSPSEAYRLRRRFLLAALAWIVLVLVAAWSGLLARADLRPPPLVGLLLSVLILGPVIAWSAVGRRLAGGLSLAVLVGLQSFRLPLEVLMHRAAERGIMPMQMS